MRWLDLLLGRPVDDAATAPLDVERELEMGLRDPDSARAAIKRLQQEKQRLNSTQRAVEKASGQLTSANVRRAAYSSKKAWDPRAYEVSDTLRDAYEGGADVTASKEQIASIEATIQKIDDAIVQLRAVRS